MNFCRARGILRGPCKADLPRSSHTSVITWSNVKFRQIPAVECDERDANDPGRVKTPTQSCRRVRGRTLLGDA